MWEIALDALLRGEYVALHKEVMRAMVGGSEHRDSLIEVAGSSRGVELHIYIQRIARTSRMFIERGCGAIAATLG